MNENPYPYLEALRKLHARLLDERREWRFRVQSSLIMVSATTFAVVVSLSPSTDTLCSKVALTVSLVANAICILFSGISVYETISTSRDAVNIVRRYIHRLSPGNVPSGSDSEFLSVPERRIFEVFEKCSYVSFVVYILALAAYGIARIYVH